MTLIYFLDMTFIHEGNKTFFNGLVNFEKMVILKFVKFIIIKIVYILTKIICYYYRDFCPIQFEQ